MTANDDMIGRLVDAVRALELRVAELTAMVGYIPSTQEITEADLKKIPEAAARITPQAIPRSLNLAIL